MPIPLPSLPVRRAAYRQIMAVGKRINFDNHELIFNIWKKTIRNCRDSIIYQNGHAKYYNKDVLVYNILLFMYGNYANSDLPPKLSNGQIYKNYWPHTKIGRIMIY